MVILKQLAILSITGEEAKAFLQAQLTSDVSALNNTFSAHYTAYCSPKGRMLANGYLAWVNDQQYYWVVHQDVVERLVKRLSMFVLRSKVRLALLDWSVLGWCEATKSAAMSERVSETELQPQLSVVEASATSITLALPGGRFCNAIAKEDSNYAHLVSEAYAETSAEAHAAIDEWELRSIDAEEVLIDGALFEELIPQMIEWDRLLGVSFKKGCYPGQEIVARTHYIGKMKRRLFRATALGSSPVTGTTITLQVPLGDDSPTPSDSPQVVGVVVRSVSSLPGMSSEATFLAVLSTNFVDKTSALVLNDNSLDAIARPLMHLEPCFASNSQLT